MDNRKFLCTDYDIMVVDSQGERREKACSILYSYGVSTDEADSGSNAVKLVKGHQYDMIFVCSELSDMDGINAIRNILAAAWERKYAPLMIAFSEHMSPEEMETYKQNGFCVICSLPYDPQEIHDILDQWIPEKRKTRLSETSSSSSDADVAKLFMAGVDVISAIKTNLGIDNYLDLLEIFYIDGVKRVISLDENIQTGDWKNYIIQVHGLKSAAANIGANTLSGLAKQHEASGNDADYDYIKSHKEELFEVYRNILSEIERVLRSISYGTFAAKEEVSLSPIDQNEMIRQIKTALGQLESFHSKECAKSVEELLAHVLPDAVRQALEGIQDLLKMYEDDEAEEKFRALVTELET